MLNDIMSEQDLTKYNTCAKICGIIMSEIIAKIQTGEILNTRDLNEYGDNRVIEECSKIYKREIIKGIAFPTSISLNNLSSCSTANDAVFPIYLKYDRSRCRGRTTLNFKSSTKR